MIDPLWVFAPFCIALAAGFAWLAWIWFQTF